jgi:hypothetical protein
MRNFLPGPILLERRVAGELSRRSRSGSRQNGQGIHVEPYCANPRINAQASRAIAASISSRGDTAESQFGKTLANVGDESGSQNLH